MIQNAVKTLSGEGMTKGEMLKMAAGIIVGVGADMALSAFLGAHMPEGVGWRRVMRRIGIFVLSMKIGEDAENYFNKVFDETREAMSEAKKEMQKSSGPEGTVE